METSTSEEDHQATEAVKGHIETILYDARTYRIGMILVSLPKIPSCHKSVIR
jgi:hypothetical protein